MPCRSSYRTVLTTSVTWVVRHTCGLVRWTRSPTPVRLGVKTSCPAARSGPRTLRKPCAPPHAPCTKTKTAVTISPSRHRRHRQASGVTLTQSAFRSLAQPNDRDARYAIYSRLVCKSIRWYRGQTAPVLQLSTWSSLVLYHLGVCRRQTGYESGIFGRMTPSGPKGECFAAGFV